MNNKGMLANTDNKPLAIAKYRVVRMSPNGLVCLALVCLTLPRFVILSSFADFSFYEKANIYAG